MKLFYEEQENGKFIKTYGDENLDVRLDEVIIGMQSKSGVEIQKIDVEEMAESDMQNFGEDSFLPEQLGELHRFTNGEKYLYNVFLNYNNNPVELSILNKTIIVSSTDSSLELSDIYEDVKKNEISQMLNEDNNKGINLSSKKMY